MARWGSIKSLADIERRIEQGRGSGEGDNYRPWIFVHEVSSRGRSHKIPGVKIRRTHHLLSDLEASFLRFAEYSPHVSDIREQFPLLPYGATSDIAGHAGIRHPRDRGASVDKVMTTDFFLTISVAPSKTPRKIAVDIKYADALSDPRELEKLEIARRYWSERQTPWYLLTERQIPAALCANLNWLRIAALLEEHLRDPELQRLFARDLVIQHTTSIPLGGLINGSAARFDLSRSDACFLFKHLVWHRVLQPDLVSPIKLKQPLPTLVMPSEAAEKVPDMMEEVI